MLRIMLFQGTNVHLLGIEVNKWLESKGDVTEINSVEILEITMQTVIGRIDMDRHSEQIVTTVMVKYRLRE